VFVQEHLGDVLLRCGVGRSVAPRELEQVARAKQAAWPEHEAGKAFAILTLTEFPSPAPELFVPKGTHLVTTPTLSGH